MSTRLLAGWFLVRMMIGPEDGTHALLLNTVSYTHGLVLNIFHKMKMSLNLDSSISWCSIYITLRDLINQNMSLCKIKQCQTVDKIQDVTAQFFMINFDGKSM